MCTEDELLDVVKFAKKLYSEVAKRLDISSIVIDDETLHVATDLAYKYYLFTRNFEGAVKSFISYINAKKEVRGDE